MFEVLRDCGALARVLPEVDRLFGVPQRADYHPEVDTGVHLMMVLDMAARLGTQPRRCATPASATTSARARRRPTMLPRHLGHEQRSVELVRADERAAARRQRLPRARRGRRPRARQHPSQRRVRRGGDRAPARALRRAAPARSLRRGAARLRVRRARPARARGAAVPAARPACSQALRPRAGGRRDRGRRGRGRARRRRARPSARRSTPRASRARGAAELAWTSQAVPAVAGQKPIGANAGRPLAKAMTLNSSPISCSWTSFSASTRVAQAGVREQLAEAAVEQEARLRGVADDVEAGVLAGDRERREVEMRR